jgi:DNA polymerase-3 subunit chi
MIVVVDGLEAENLQTFARCADVFDGNDADAVEAARGRWRRAREAGHNLTYWQQTASGWEQKG